MLTKKTLLVRTFAAKGDSRPEISGVLTFKGGAAATDSYCLAEIRMKSPLPASDFPLLPESPAPQDLDENLILPAAFVAELAKSISSKPTLPALDCAAYCGKDKDGNPIFLTTDLETSQEHKTRAIEGHWPDYLKLIPKQEPTAKISISPELLLKAAKLLSAFNKKGAGLPRVELSIYGATDPVMLTSETSDHKAMVLVMPIKV